MDATPQNPKKPRPSRRLLSHFTLTLSVLLALSFVALGVVGPTTQEAEALDWEDIAVVGMNAGIGAGAGASVGGPLGAVIGGVTGAAIGAYLVLMDSEKSESALSSAAKGAYASALMNITNDYLGLAYAQVDNLNTLWNTSQYYLVRKAEWAAQQLYDYQIANGLSTVYDPYAIMADSEVANATVSYSWAMCQQISAVLNSHSDLASTFVGTYAGMSWGIMFGGDDGGTSQYAKSVRSTIDSKTNRIVDFRSAAITGASEYVTVSANQTITIVLLASGAAPLSGASLTITHRNGTIAYQETGISASTLLYKDVNLAELGFKSGDYNFYFSADGDNDMLNKRMFPCGYFSKAIASSGELHPTILSGYLQNGTVAWDNWGAFMTDQWGLQTWKTENYMTNVNLLSNERDPAYIFFDTDGNWDSGMKKISLTTAAQKIYAINNKVAQLQTTTNSFAQTYYNYLVANGPDAPRIMPDIIFPDPSELEGMSWQQIYAMFLAYLTQMDPWFEENSVMGMDDVNISKESLNLLCRGAIYNASGGMVYNDTTVWTPYISLEDMTLTVGQNNTMTQPGFIIVWGNAADLHNFTQPTTCVYLPVTAGWNLSIEEMTLKGAQVTETTLTVTNIEWIIYGPGGNITPPQITTQTDLDWIISHWYYIAMIGGVICLLGAIATRNMPILAAGLVLLAAGAIGWYLAGDTSLLDWLSIEPPNLRAWLQNLR